MPVIAWSEQTTIGAASAGPKAAALVNGGFVLVWTQGEGNSREVWFQVFDAFGQPTGAAALFDAGNASEFDPEVTATDAGFVITLTRDFYDDGADFDAVGQRYDLTGAVVADAGVSEAGSGFDETSPDYIYQASGFGQAVYMFGNEVRTAQITESGDQQAIYTLGTVSGGGDPTIVRVTDTVDIIVWNNAGNLTATLLLSGAPANLTWPVDSFGLTVSGYDVARVGENGAYAVGYVSENGDARIGVYIENGLLQELNLPASDGAVNAIRLLDDGQGGFFAIYGVTSEIFPDMIMGRHFTDDPTDDDTAFVSGPVFAVAAEGFNELSGVALLADGRIVVSYLEGLGGQTAAYQILDPREGVITDTDGVGLLIGNDLTNDFVRGLAGEDVLFGLNGNDRLDGGSGFDVMFGGAGDDVYVIDSSGDVVVENAGEGIDTVRSSIGFDGSIFSNQAIENFTLTGLGNVNATGYNGRNVLVGNSGNNELNGKGGDDVMGGGRGDDTYVVDRAGDQTFEEVGAGTDTVKAALSWTLGINIEKLVLVGTGAFSATGNSLDNTIFGNGAANLITGGDGRDVMTGGAGNDTFDFNTAIESVFATPDRITDLASGDKIDLSTIDANANAGGNQAFTRVAAFNNTAGQLTVTYVSNGNYTDVRGDVNGDGTADFRIFLTGDQTAFTGWVF